MGEKGTSAGAKSTIPSIQQCPRQKINCFSPQQVFLLLSRTYASRGDGLE